MPYIFYIHTKYKLRFAIFIIVFGVDNFCKQIF